MRMTKNKDNQVYFIGDGDDIRKRVEFFLFNEDMAALSRFSKNLSKAIKSIEEFVASQWGGDILMAGGDDVIFSIDKQFYSKSEMESAMSDFHRATGSTISFGVGATIESAYLNLRRAKASGKGRIVDLGIE